MDIRTELHNLKRMVLSESHISETTKEKIANRIFEIEKSLAINYTHCCETFDCGDNRVLGVARCKQQCDECKEIYE